MSAAHHLNPSDHSNDQLDRFLFALMGRMNVHYINGSERPMNKTQIAEYLGYTEQHVDKLVKAGVLKAHRLYDGADPRFFASECERKLKNS